MPDHEPTAGAYYDTLRSMTDDAEILAAVDAAEQGLPPEPSRVQRIGRKIREFLAE